MASAFPTGRTAFLVIHGIGEQRPFETLDGYARGVIDEFRDRGAAFSIEHRIAESTAGGSGWTESFVRLQENGSDNAVDIHECYWAYLTEQKASLRDIWNWLALTAIATARYYRENEALQRAYEERRKQRGASVFRFPIYRFLFAALTIYPLIWLAGKLIPRAIRTLVAKAMRPLGTQVIVGYVGDVAIYTTTDEKSKFFPIRSKILEVSQALLESLLADGRYDRVVLVGHSLGSVIAYDTLNRLNLKANLHPAFRPQLARLHGLVTFGSPLDKIAFFFREHTRADEYVRRGILDALHSFRAKPLHPDAPQSPMTTQIRPLLGNFPWLNFFDAQDPVSGHLDFYADVENRQLDMGARWGLAHTAYWKDTRFYRESLARLFHEIPGA